MLVHCCTASVPDSVIPAQVMQYGNRRDGEAGRLCHVAKHSIPGSAGNQAKIPVNFPGFITPVAAGQRLEVRFRGDGDPVARSQLRLMASGPHA